jgi:hypothetical protein
MPWKRASAAIRGSDLAGYGAILEAQRVINHPHHKENSMKMDYLSNIVFCLVLSMIFIGCSKQTNPMERGAPGTPKEAAELMDQAFASADAQKKAQAAAASQALKNLEYEKAVISLQLLKKEGNLTAEQGVAVHRSMVSLEAKIIDAIDAGNENAKRAYEQLKKARRN